MFVIVEMRFFSPSGGLFFRQGTWPHRKVPHALLWLHSHLKDESVLWM